jgi:hypothetical protein
VAWGPSPTSTLGPIWWPAFGILTSYDKDSARTPIDRWLRDEKLRYIDNAKSPTLAGTSWLQLPRVLRQDLGSKANVVTERNLVKYRQVNPSTDEPASPGSNFRATRPRPDQPTPA